MSISRSRSIAISISIYTYIYIHILNGCIVSCGRFKGCCLMRVWGLGSGVWQCKSCKILQDQGFRGLGIRVFDLGFPADALNPIPKAPCTFIADT